MTDDDDDEKKIVNLRGIGIISTFIVYKYSFCICNQASGKPIAHRFFYAGIFSSKLNSFSTKYSTLVFLNSFALNRILYSSTSICF